MHKAVVAKMEDRRKDATLIAFRTSHKQHAEAILSIEKQKWGHSTTTEQTDPQLHVFSN